MKTNIATDKLQSQRLLRCGVSADTADMFYQTPITASQNATRKDIFLVRKADENLFDTDTPAWSLSALLGLLPKELEYFHFTKWYAPFQDGWDIIDKENGRDINGEVKLYFSDGTWIVDYDWDGFDGKLPQSDSPIEACVLVIELLVANGYKLNEI